MTIPTMQLLCSTGAFSRHPDKIDHNAIHLFGPQLEVDGLEVIFYPGWYASEDRIANDLAGWSLPYKVLHAEKDIGPQLGASRKETQQQGLQLLEANCRFARIIGANLLVFHLWGYRDEQLHMERCLSILPQCVDIAEHHGLHFAVETIPSSTGDTLDRVRRAMEADSRCVVALDTEFLAGQELLEDALQAGWLWEEGRVRHAHIKDYDGAMVDADNRRRYLHPGEGHIDFERFFSGLKERDFNGFVSLEASAIGRDGKVDMPKLTSSLAALRDLITQEDEVAIP
jgi:sugar phosphate isomerase/epimerase